MSTGGSDLPLIRVVVDSSSNVPVAVQARHHMIEVPALVNFGAESYRNNVEMSVDEFYVRFAAAPELPTTSQPPPQLFADAYRQALAEGAQHIFVCTVSAKLSGTYSSAVMAAQDVGAERVTVWDGDSASMGSGWQAIEAARRIEAGDSLEAMLAHVSQVRSQTLGYVTVETLRYLARSGRVSNGTQALVGGDPHAHPAPRRRRAGQRGGGPRQRPGGSAGPGRGSLCRAADPGVAHRRSRPGHRQLDRPRLCGLDGLPRSAGVGPARQLVRVME